MQLIYRQKKEKEELRNNIQAKTIDNDPAPIANKINRVNMEIRELEIKVNVNKGQYKILVDKAKKYQHTKQYETKIEALNQEILAER